jgi:hypothetical protein
MEEPAIEEMVAAEEAAMVWRSRPHRVAVGGGVEEPATPGRGGARGGASCSGGSGVEEPGPLGGRVSVGRCR